MRIGSLLEVLWLPSMWVTTVQGRTKRGANYACSSFVQVQQVSHMVSDVCNVKHEAMWQQMTWGS